MAQPTEKGRVIHIATGDDAIPASRFLLIDTVYAEGAGVLTDAAGNEIWEAAGAGPGPSFEGGLPVRGLDLTGTGPMKVYLL